MIYIYNFQKSNLKSIEGENKYVQWTWDDLTRTVQWYLHIFGYLNKILEVIATCNLKHSSLPLTFADRRKRCSYSIHS